MGMIDQLAGRFISLQVATASESQLFNQYGAKV